ncbi:condensation domain-containing protein [Nocardiopsis composta]
MDRRESPKRKPPKQPFPGESSGEWRQATARQAALCTLHQLDPSTPGLMLSLAFRLPCETDVEALKTSVLRLLLRYPALRSVFRRGESGWEVCTPPCNSVPGNDHWSAETLPPTASEKEAGDALRRFCREVPALDSGALFRAHLVTGAGGVFLAVAIHHSVVDLWSTGLLASLLGLFYEEETGGEPAPFPLPRPQDGQAQEKARRGRERSLPYWSALYAAPTPPLRLTSPPLAGSAPAEGPVLARESVHLPIDLGPERTSALAAAAKAHHTTRHTLLFAAQALAAARAAGVERLPLTMPQHRRSASTMTVVDFVSSNYVLPLDLRGATAAEIVRAVGGRIREARAHQWIDFDELALHHRADVAHLPEPELSLVVYEQTPGAPDSTAGVLLGTGVLRSGPLTLTPVFGLPSVGPLPLVTALAEHEGRLVGRLEFDPLRCTPRTAEQLREELVTAVDDLAGPPQVKVRRVRATAAPKGEATPTTAASAETLAERVGETWARTLSLPTVGPDDDFYTLGGHSLLAAALARALSVEFGVDVRPGDVMNHPSVREQSRFIAECLDAPGGRSGPAATSEAIRPALRRPLHAFASDASLSSETRDAR